MRSSLYRWGPKRFSPDESLHGQHRSLQVVPVACQVRPDDVPFQAHCLKSNPFFCDWRWRFCSRPVRASRNSQWRPSGPRRVVVKKNRIIFFCHNFFWIFPLSVSSLLFVSFELSPELFCHSRVKFQNVSFLREVAWTLLNWALHTLPHFRNMHRANTWCSLKIILKRTVTERTLTNEKMTNQSIFYRSRLP